MKFQLDIKVQVGDDLLDPSALQPRIDSLRDSLKDVAALEGVIIIRLDGKPFGEDLTEPLLRLAMLWTQKLPWIVGGDTETIPYRNSEHCLAFVPAGDGVEMSMYLGSGMEVEEYVVDPTTVRLDQFAAGTLKLGEQLIEIIKLIDPKLMQSNEDARDLQASVAEGQKAWREHQLHQRR